VGDEYDLLVVNYFLTRRSHLGASKARSSLDGRWFGGRKISATVYSKEKFERGDY
jgi:hypothetical protein